MFAKQQKETLPQEEFVARLAETLGDGTDARHIFAPPVERNGITVIPVARARYGFGGGSGTNNKQQGYGGGGGATIQPTGYIEITDGHACYRPIRDPLTLIPAVAVGGILSYLAIRELTKLLRLS